MVSQPLTNPATAAALGPASPLASQQPQAQPPSVKSSTSTAQALSAPSAFNLSNSIFASPRASVPASNPTAGPANAAQYYQQYNQAVQAANTLTGTPFNVALGQSLQAPTTQPISTTSTITQPTTLGKLLSSNPSTSIYGVQQSISALDPNYNAPLNLVFAPNSTGGYNVAGFEDTNGKAVSDLAIGNYNLKLDQSTGQITINNQPIRAPLTPASAIAQVNKAVINELSPQLAQPSSVFAPRVGVSEPQFSISTNNQQSQQLYPPQVPSSLQPSTSDNILLTKLYNSLPTPAKTLIESITSLTNPLVQSAEAFKYPLGAVAYELGYNTPFTKYASNLVNYQFAVAPQNIQNFKAQYVDKAPIQNQLVYYLVLAPYLALQSPAAAVYNPKSTPTQRALGLGEITGVGALYSLPFGRAYSTGLAAIPEIAKFAAGGAIANVGFGAIGSALSGQPFNPMQSAVSGAQAGAITAATIPLLPIGRLLSASGIPTVIADRITATPKIATAITNLIPKIGQGAIDLGIFNAASTLTAANAAGVQPTAQQLETSFVVGAIMGAVLTPLSSAIGVRIESAEPNVAQGQTALTLNIAGKSKPLIGVMQDATKAATELFKAPEFAGLTSDEKISVLLSNLGLLQKTLFTGFKGFKLPDLSFLPESLSNENNVNYLAESGLGRQVFIDTLEKDPAFLANNPNAKNLIEYIKQFGKTAPQLKDIFEPLTKKTVSNADLISKLNGMSLQDQQAFVAEHPDIIQGRLSAAGLTPLQSAALDNYLRFQWNVKEFGTASVKQSFGADFRTPHDIDLYLYTENPDAAHETAQRIAQFLSNIDPANKLAVQEGSNLVNGALGKALDIHFMNEEQTSGISQAPSRPFGFILNEPLSSAPFGYLVEPAGNTYLGKASSALTPRIIDGKFVIAPADYRIKDLVDIVAIGDKLLADADPITKIKAIGAWNEFRNNAANIFEQVKSISTDPEYKSITWQEALDKAKGSPQSINYVAGTKGANISPTSVLASAAETAISKQLTSQQPVQATTITPSYLYDPNTDTTVALNQGINGLGYNAGLVQSLQQSAAQNAAQQQLLNLYLSQLPPDIRAKLLSTAPTSSVSQASPSESTSLLSAVQSPSLSSATSPSLSDIYSSISSASPSSAFYASPSSSVSQYYSPSSSEYYSLSPSLSPSPSISTSESPSSSYYSPSSSVSEQQKTITELLNRRNIRKKRNVLQAEAIPSYSAEYRPSITAELLGITNPYFNPLSATTSGLALRPLPAELPPEVRRLIAERAIPRPAYA